MLDIKTEVPSLRDEDGAIQAAFVARVTQAIEAVDTATLRELTEDLHESDLGALLEALDPDLRPRLVELLGIDFDFTALTEVDDKTREEILEELPSRTVAEGVRDIESDDAVTILADMPQDEQAEILGHLPAPERQALARSLRYPEGSAGRRMQSEFIAVPPAWNVGQAIDYMRETAGLPERFYELYVVDTAGRFLGAVPFGLFEGQLQKMVALAVRVPIVASQGGNATTQTMTVAVRALATRELSAANARRVILRELLVGMVNGLAFAVITGIAAYVWFRVPALGIVIGLAMVCNLVAAALGGILIPLGLNRLKVDPAVASSPYVTTVTDVVGFFSFLSIATFWFGLR
jgi:Mg/Co/Ni transporter MgtE